MEQIYAAGVNIIELVQYWFADYDWYFHLVNDLSNPHYVLEVLFPVVSVFDAVFASQLLLSMGVGGWLNAVTKWWFLEDRPYWWIRETNFYTIRPQLAQSPQTCETGPGSPSGHSMISAMVLMLFVMWISHVMNDRKYYIRWWKLIVYPTCAGALLSVMLSRLYIATHFPHQCLLGALIGLFLAPALCIYISDPYIWQYGTARSKRTKWYHIAMTLGALFIAVATYFGLKLLGLDPQATVKLAFRWCESPQNIHVSTTPLFALVQTIAAMTSWALFVTPEVAKFRHNTKNRSLILSSLYIGIIVYILYNIQENISTYNAFIFYLSHYIIGVLKPFLLLRVAAYASMWPYTVKSKEKTQ